MVSLRTLEREEQIVTHRRATLPWLLYAESLTYDLVQYGLDFDQSEELSDFAMVQVYGQDGNRRISEQRAKRDMRSAAFGELHRQSAERQESQPAASLPEKVGKNRIDLRDTSAAVTVSIREALRAARRKTDIQAVFCGFVCGVLESVLEE